MKKTNLYTGMLAVAFLVAASTSSAFAASSMLNLDVDAQSNSSLGASTTGVSAGVSGSVTSTGNSSSTVNDTSSSADMNGNGSLMLNINGNDVRGMSDVKMNVSSSAQVQSANDLQSYAQVIAKQDSSIEAVTSDNTSVNVVFKRPAKFLGFIPVTLHENANVQIDSEGKAMVTVKKPWWSFLASGDVRSDEMSAKIQSAVSGMSGSFSASANLTASQEAAILAAISNSATSVYASSTANASANGQASY